MLIGIIFVLGIANFAVHKAVIESDHPLLDTLPASFRARGGRFSLMFEFFVLLAAMLLAGSGWRAAVWGYGIYTVINGVTAWLLLNRRI
ncbi:hypothetical protein [Erythrobacter sp.]|uniref:hypothetical protein n=1 Tax=Erythrobacter sp. TaxID=1042 RepID=UPI001B12E5B8|nr:hypothetical protein [Erythrobacter sp.]MBO6528105.1 hypothetical protein [Erythrobacter sp.]MBO6530893.1 hypothetical protein [Erythrobacter sp.]